MGTLPKDGVCVGSTDPVHCDWSLRKKCFDAIDTGACPNVYTWPTCDWCHTQNLTAYTTIVLCTTVPD